MSLNRAWNVYWVRREPDRIVFLKTIEAPWKDTAHKEACKLFGTTDRIERFHSTPQNIWVGESHPQTLSSHDRLQRVERIDRPLGGLSPYQVARLKALMLSRLDQHVTLAEMAAHLGLRASSRPYVVRGFKLICGVTPYQWQLSRRIMKAKWLLGATELPIMTVSRLVGYADQRVFCRTFRRVAGCSATNWRKGMRDRVLRDLPAFDWSL